MIFSYRNGERQGRKHRQSIQSAWKGARVKNSRFNFPDPLQNGQDLKLLSLRGMLALGQKGQALKEVTLAYIEKE